MSSEALKADQATKAKSDVLSKTANPTLAVSKTMNSSKTNLNRVTKTIVTSPEIYKPVGPYSQAILADKTLYVSGVLGMDPQAQLVCGGAEAQARQALTNLRHVLEAGGASLESVVKTTILLNDISDFQAVNQVYSEFFTRDYPARATYQVGRLPAGAAVEIEAIALSGDLVVAEAGPCPCAREQGLYTEKNIKFLVDTEDLKPVQELDDMIDGVNQTKAIIENTVLPTCDTLDEPILLSRTDKSSETARQRIDKDVQTDSFRIDNENAWIETLASSQEEKETAPKLEEVVEQVVEMLSSGRSTDGLNTPERGGAQAATEIGTDAACVPPLEINTEQEIEHKELDEATSPSQSESSRATRWEALADIAAELPPSLAVDPLTGQIYTLK